MHELTPRMIQGLRKNPKAHHSIFDGGRCGGWRMEELPVKAIQSDTHRNDHPIWKKNGHDDEADIAVVSAVKKYPINVKSGKLNRGLLTLSGHRLGHFNADFGAITDYLNNVRADMPAVPYVKDVDKGPNARVIGGPSQTQGDRTQPAMRRFRRRRA